ncbi:MULTISPECIES: hypothetical protein [unclassified Streptomyces]|uniref:hypothetical protein n=1 Tax=unclassified Streptomyces TaxID=2593676 RepID=UPI002E28CAA5|nr:MULTISPECIES: hypothetical protein [unclassified Streptomyces]
MGARVVYVHGNGNKVRESLLKSRWDTALFGVGLGGASHMAYWAPLRYPAPLPDAGPDPLDGEAGEAGEVVAFEESPAPGAAADESSEEFAVRVFAEARGEAAADPAEGVAQADGPAEAALGNWLRDMAYLADALAEGGAEGEMSPEAVPRQRIARTPLFRLLVEHTFKDVYAYFFGGAGPAMRDVVRSALDAAFDAARDDEPDPGPLVVIGHNLGSVIAYEVLREQERAADLFVTVGSPLAVTEIQNVLAAPPAVPTGVAAWHNASDPRDLVALDHTLRPEYAPARLVFDHLVHNGSRNHHGIREYLGTAAVRNPVRLLFGRLATEQTE